MKNVIKAITSAALSGCMLIPFFSLDAGAEYTAETANKNLKDSISYIDGTKHMGDFNNDGFVKAEDAANLLKYTVGLVSAPDDSEFTYRCDMNGDGSITPADARLVLRIAANLDNEALAYLNFFNSSLNSVKANNNAFRAVYRSAIQKKDYDNKELANSFQNQMNNFINGVNKFIMDGDDKLPSYNFDDEFKTVNHNLEDDYAAVTNNTVCSASRAIKFPITDNEMGSLLEFSDISKIEYNENDSADFILESRQTKKTTGEYDILYTGSTGECSSITVYIKPENFVSIPDDSTQIPYGRVYNLPSFEDAANGFFNDMDDTYGQFLSGSSGSIDKIGFSDSYIKLYFNKDAARTDYYGKPIYIDYHLNYVFDYYCHLKVNITMQDMLDAAGVDASKASSDLISFFLDIPDVKVDDYVVMSTWFSDRTQFFFQFNK